MNKILELFYQKPLLNVKEIEKVLSMDPGQDCREIGAGPDIVPIPFAENGNIAKFGKWRFTCDLQVIPGIPSLKDRHLIFQHHLISDLKFLLKPMENLAASFSA